MRACVRALPLHHERVFLFHGEVWVDLNGIIFVLQLQQLLPALLCHQLAVVYYICTDKQNGNDIMWASNREDDDEEFGILN